MKVLQFLKLYSHQQLKKSLIPRFYRGSRIQKITGEEFTNNDFNLRVEKSKQTNKTHIKADLYHKDKDLEIKIEEKFKNAPKSHPNSDLDKWLDFPSDTLVFRDQLKERERMNQMRDQASKAFRPKTDPRVTSIMMFPGQGSQFVGMGKELLQYPKVEDLYRLAGRILNLDLLSICLQGPANLLDKTINCQPAVVVTSIAAIEKLKHDKPWAIQQCITSVGYSVGEITALVFAGVLSFEDAMHIVKARSEAMQKASEEMKGGMLTVFTTADTKLKFACSAAKKYCMQELGMDEAVCAISNYLHPSCKVIAGNIEAVDFVVRNAKEFSINRTRFLAVSGAFHTPLMQKAAETFSKKLDGIKFNDPIIPVHSNVTGHRFINADHVKKLMVRQIYSPVKWEQTMHCLFTRPSQHHLPSIYEVGPGKQLGSLLKMVNNRAFAEYKSIDV